MTTATTTKKTAAPKNSSKEPRVTGSFFVAYDNDGIVSVDKVDDYGDAQDFAENAFYGGPMGEVVQIDLSLPQIKRLDSVRTIKVEA